MRIRARSLVLLVTLQLVVANAAAAQFIGPGLGQTFRSPPGNPFLQAINTGDLSGDNRPGATYTYFLFLLNGLDFSGPPVFQQTLATVADPFQELAINRSLLGNQPYVFFLGTDFGSEFAGGAPGQVPDGNIVFCNGGPPVTPPLSCVPLFGSDVDIIGFTTTYATTTPEPPALLLFAAGLAGLGVLKRRRRWAA